MHLKQWPVGIINVGCGQEDQGNTYWKGTPSCRISFSIVDLTEDMGVEGWLFGGMVSRPANETCMQLLACDRIF
jgi:hypothetical protein